MDKAVEQASAPRTCIVVGAGHAGSQLALQLRKEGWEGEIILIGAEPQLPYHRPPLSKAVLAGEKQIEDVLLRPPAMYENNSIQLRLGEQVEAVLPEQHVLRLDTGDLLSYDKLALCTGARVIHLPLGEHLDNVFYLRSAADVAAIRKNLSAGKKAVIIGAGYIGMETAAVLNTLGLDVTVLERADRILQRVTSEPVSRYFTRLHEKHGVRVVSGVEVSAISGASRVESVRCTDGQHYPADIVIIGIGVLPETRLAEMAGLRIENGIQVDAQGRSSNPDIFAAGDCTSHPNALYKRQVRLESVQNANDQARVAAAAICGKGLAYDALPWFWSDQYQTKLQSAGLSSGHDQLLLRGDPDNGVGFTVLYGKNGRLIAADCIDRPKEFLLCKKLVQQQVLLDRDMTDESLELVQSAKQGE